MLWIFRFPLCFGWVPNHSLHSRGVFGGFGSEMIRAGTSRRRKCKAFAEVRQYLAEELLRFFEIGDSPTTVVGWKKKREREGME